jgi:hypothetical protein
MAMSTTPTNVNFDDLQPPAKPDSFNIEWQADTPVPDPNSPGDYVRNVSACYQTPPVGGDIVLTADYDLGGPDTGLTFICNSATPITIKLPPAIPQLPNPQGVWRVKIKNVGAGLVTVDPNGLNLDNSAAVVTLSQNSGFEISTDNAGYWTFGNFSTSIPTIVSVPATANPGAFQIAHGLGRAPSAVSIVATSDGIIRLNAPKFDATYVYLSASDGGLTCDLLLW